MSFQFEKYKGIHPGIILERLLAKKGISQSAFAISIDENPQTINVITKGKKSLNTTLAIKIEAALGLEEGSLTFLQSYCEIAKEKKKTLCTPNLSNLRKSLFWDTDISKIDWDKQYRAVIQRVYERGNEIEKQELINFYGQEKINVALSTISRDLNLIKKIKCRLDFL